MRRLSVAAALAALSLVPAVARAQDPAPPPLPVGDAPVEESLRARHGHQFVADPFLLVASLGVGFETEDRGSANAPHDVVPSRPLDFHIAGSALWDGLVGPTLGLYASSGSAIQVGASGGKTQPGFGDRVSLVAALSLRPLAFLAWSRGDGWVSRLAGGVGLELGVSAELARTSLDSAAAPGFHALVSVDVPLSGGGSNPGLALRLSGRLLVSPDQNLAVDPATKVPQVVEPGTVLQLYAGLAYYL